MARATSKRKKKASKTKPAANKAAVQRKAKPVPSKAATAPKPPNKAAPKPPNKAAPKPAGDAPRLAKRLMDAASQGQLDEITTLLERGCDPNVLHQDCSALAWAAYKGHVDIVKALLARGANPNAGKSYPCAGGAMHAAADRGSVEILDLLLAAGGDPDVEGQKTDCRPLFNAASKGHAAAVARLLEQGADPKTDVDGKTAMLAAARGGSVEVLELLYAAGAPIAGWRLPLHQAVYSNQPAAVTWFLEHGSDVEARDGEQTPLHVAAELEGAGNLIDVLIAHGARVDARVGEHGMTALQIAIQQGYVENVERLIRHGASPTIPTGEPDWADARAMAAQFAETHPVEDWGDDYARILALVSQDGARA